MKATEKILPIKCNKYLYRFIIHDSCILCTLSPLFFRMKKCYTITVRTTEWLRYTIAVPAAVLRTARMLKAIDYTPVRQKGRKR